MIPPVVVGSMLSTGDLLRWSAFDDDVCGLDDGSGPHPSFKSQFFGRFPAHERDDPEIAAKALAASGLDAAKLLTRSQEPDVKAKLIENTQSAVERGAFGSPTFFVGKEMFFGKEQLREVEEMIAGK